MKHSFTMRMISFVLALVIVLGVIPANTVHVHATEVDDHQGENHSSVSTLSVTNDDTNLEIDYEKPPYKVDSKGNPVYDEKGNLIYLTPQLALSEAAEAGLTITDSSYDEYYSDENKTKWRQVFKGDFDKLREWLESDDPDDRYIVLMEDIKKTVSSGSFESIQISSVKILDLNGHTLELYDKRNGTSEQNSSSNSHTSTLFEINGTGYTQGDDVSNPKKGALLTIIDSAGSNVVITDAAGEIAVKEKRTGRIYTNAYMINHQKWDFWYYTHRDIFHVLNGDLVIYGGEFQAGRQKDQMKKNFSWDKLKTVIGDAVTLGTAIYEYATGITAAEAARNDLLNIDMYKDLKEDLKDKYENTEEGESEGTSVKKDGSGGTEEKKNETPASTGADANNPKKDETKDQTVAQKQNDNNKKEEDEKKGDKGSGNEANKDKTAKSDENTKIAEANKAIGSAALNKDKISAMVDSAIALGEGLYGLFGSQENTRATACIHGTVARVGNGCTLVVYGGNFIGHGSTPNVRNAVIEVSHVKDLKSVINTSDPLYGKSNGGLVYIYDGRFTAKAGANVFNMYTVNNSESTIVNTYEVTTTDTGADDAEGNPIVESEDAEKKRPMLFSETYGVREVRFQTKTEKGVSTEIPVNTSNITVRGGEFRCYFEPTMMCTLNTSTKGTDESEGLYCPECDKYDDDCDDVDHHKFTGTAGTVNLGVESFGVDLIKDGRIQLVDVYGVGKLVLLDGGEQITDNEDEMVESLTWAETLEEQAKESISDYPGTAPENTYTTNITAEDGIRHYRLFISDTELRCLEYLTVGPNTADTNSTYSFSLKTYYGKGTRAASAWVTDEENIRAPYSSNEGYFEFEYDDLDTSDGNSGGAPGVYVIPELGLSNALAAGEEIAQSDVWYYNMPVNHSGESLGNFEYTDTFMTGSYGMDDDEDDYWGWLGGMINGVLWTIEKLLEDGKMVTGDYTVSFNRTREDGSKENMEKYKDKLTNKDYYTATYDNYNTNIKFFVYKIYRVDPLTRENINESDDWAADEPLLEMRYGATNDSLKCKITLKEMEKAIARKLGDPSWTFRSGELYRIEFTVQEHMGFGYLGSQQDGEVEFVNHLEPATASSSILFRIVEKDEDKDVQKTNPVTGVTTYYQEPDWTPLQFVKQNTSGEYYKNEAVMAGDYATVELLNGQPSLVDYEGARIFDIYYQWYILDDPEDETPTLIAGTDNVWVAQNALGGKQFHKPDNWLVTEDGTGNGINGEKYANTVDPDSEEATKYTYFPNGLPMNPTDQKHSPDLWNYKMLHMYTQETCAAHDGMKKDVDDALYMANNNAKWGNTDSLYIPEEYAGKYLQCKMVVVNVRYPWLYDNLQTLTSHTVLILDPSMLIPATQEPAMVATSTNYDGSIRYAATEVVTLGQSKLYGFTHAEQTLANGYMLQISTRVEDKEGNILYEAKNGNLIDLKDIISEQGDYQVKQIQEIVYKGKTVISHTDVFPVTATIPAPDKVDYDYAPRSFEVGETVTFTATATPEAPEGVTYWYKWVLLGDEEALEDATVLQDSDSPIYKHTFTDETPIEVGVYAYSKVADGTESLKGAWYLGWKEIYPSDEMTATIYVDGQEVEEGRTVQVEQGSTGTIEIVISGGDGEVSCIAYDGWTAIGKQTTISYDASALGTKNYSFHYSDANVSTQVDIPVEVCAPLSITNQSTAERTIGYATSVDLMVQYIGTGTTVVFQENVSGSWQTIDGNSVVTRTVSSANSEYRSGTSVAVDTVGTHTYRAVVTDMFGNTETVNYTIVYDDTVVTEVEAIFSEKPTVTVYRYNDSTKTDNRVYVYDDGDDLVIEVTAKFDLDPTSELYADARESYGNIKPVIGNLTGDITIKYYESYEAYVANYSDYTTIHDSVECITGLTVGTDGTATWKYDEDLADASCGDPGFYVCTIYLYNNDEYAGIYTYYNVSAQYLILDSGEDHVCDYSYKISKNEDGQTHTWHCVCGETKVVDHAWGSWSRYRPSINGSYVDSNLQRRFCAESSSNVSVGGWCNTYQYRLAYVDTLTLQETEITDAQFESSIQLHASLEFKDMVEGVELNGELVEPETGLTWTSSDETVATVDENGLVTIVGAGTATITVTSVAPTVLYVDGVLNPQYASASCTVTYTCDHGNVGIMNDKESDCTNAGWIEHYYCYDCGRCSLDGTFTDTVDYDTQIAKELKSHEATFVYAADETGHWRRCRYGCDTKMSEVETHTYNVEAVDCWNEVKYCTVCQYVAETHTHSCGYVEAVAVSCSTDGNIAHYACFNCGKMFADMEGTTELSEAAVVTPATEHTWTDGDCETPATCSVCGTTEGTAPGHDWVEATCAQAKHCAVCGITEGSALAHNWIAATCSAPKTCTGCWATQGEALPHSYSEATCDQGQTCTVCGWVESDPVHSLTHHPAADADCTTAGNVEYWSCSLCGNKYTEAECENLIEDVTIPATGHNYENGECTNCGQPDPDANPGTKVASGWSGSLTWTLYDTGKLVFAGTGAMKNYGYNGGQPWLNKGVDVTSVVFPEGVTSIGSGAFRNLTTLKSVTFPATTLTKMGEAAFYGSGLESVEIPASLWTIQPYTFKNCANLKSVKFNEGNLQKISDGAFYGCTSLTTLVLPDCLSILDIYAFKGCSKLASITIGDGLTELREAVFYGTAITTITIPEGITKIGPYAFKNCVKLVSVNFPSTLTSVGEASFYACTALKTVELPAKVTTIGNYAFRKCAAITMLTLSAELTTIGECAFYGCTGLTTLVIPDNVTTIKPYAFKTCTGLTSVTLGKKVSTIGEGAFNTCTGLKTIEFPASLTTIGDYCFSGSTNLWKLTFYGNAPSIGTGAFKGLNAYAYYPSGNSTWTAAVCQNYGGKITWTAK